MIFLMDLLVADQRSTLLLIISKPEKLVMGFPASFEDALGQELG
jgi:hypothetical protein